MTLRPIENYPGYQVSDTGLVFGLLKTAPLKPQMNGAGYYQVTLCNKDGHKIHMIHRLVAFAFCPITGTEVNHKKGVKRKNRAEQLEWTDRSGNQLHAHATGLKRNGNQSHLRRKLFSQEVLVIRYLCSIGMARKRIAEMFGVSVPFIWKIHSRLKWKHI